MVHTFQTQLGPKASERGQRVADAQTKAFLTGLKHPEQLKNFDINNFEEGLTVPVVHGADRLSLTEIAGQTRELVAAARAGRLTGRQVGGASLTISNLGAYGVSFGTPVLNLDERITRYVVESENFESIHNHSAYALIEKDKRGERARRAQ